MKHALDTTEIIIASWILGGGGDRIPTSHGILDRALNTVIQNGGFPEWLHSQLHFSDSRIGLQCVELPSLLDWAQRAQLTTAPNPSYHFTQIQISSKAARQVVKDLDVAEQDAIEWGKLLREAVQGATDSIADHFDRVVEEY